MQANKNRTNKIFQNFKTFFSLFGFLFFTGIVFFTWFWLDPISFRQIAFEPVRDLYYFYRELQPAKGWRQLQTLPEFNGQRIEIPPKMTGDLTLIADFWKPNSHLDTHPAILILHGSSPQGRRHGFVRMLAHEFHQRGWFVLAPDARGFGESEKPYQIQDSKSWQIGDDIKRFIDFLNQYPGVDKKRIVVLGHSMGGAMALEGALDDSRVASIIIIGPPRYLSGEKTTFWKRIRFSADRNLPAVISVKVELDRIHAGDIDRYAREGLLRKTSKPILLIDGEFERKKEQSFLKEISFYLSKNSQYQTISGVGHYCGVYHLPLTDSFFLRPELFEACIKPIMIFLDKIVETDSNFMTISGKYECSHKQ